MLLVTITGPKLTNNTFLWRCKIFLLDHNLNDKVKKTEAYFESFGLPLKGQFHERPLLAYITKTYPGPL